MAVVDLRRYDGLKSVTDTIFYDDMHFSSGVLGMTARHKLLEDTVPDNHTNITTQGLNL
jgi:hypothetical protein